jgi:hypothetical protein
MIHITVNQRELPPVNKTNDQQSDQLEGNQIMNLFQK